MTITEELNGGVPTIPVEWRPKFDLRPRQNTLDAPLLQFAKDYWEIKEVTPKGFVFEETVDALMRRYANNNLWFSPTHAARQAFYLVCVFKCHTCGKQTEEYLEPLRRVLDMTFRRPPTMCPACIAESAQEHDESELERATEFLERKIKPGTTMDAAPIIAAATSMCLETNHLTRARVKLGITSFKAGNTWRWMWPVEEDDWYVVWAQGWTKWSSFEEITPGGKR